MSDDSCSLNNYGIYSVLYDLSVNHSSSVLSWMCRKPMCSDYLRSFYFTW